MDLTFGLGACNRRSQPVEKQGPIGQARQAVMHRIVHQSFLRPFLIGHIAHQPDAAQRPAIGPRHTRRIEFEPAI